MTDSRQKIALVYFTDAGDLSVYLETEIDSDSHIHAEWIVETLPDKQFRLWTVHGVPEVDVVFYTVRETCGLEELERSGFGSVPRVTAEATDPR
ncbi:hypothetical protein [Plantibacter sp. VKM Ac-2876]|uniref:hypothetical protein n=1 Tax=Plantibacter sp. VKM Ac-2876 TaxID=2783826 RepID=UPI00188BA2DB|nr:hypothetical protein [Plantibacter sp. VKM Ac-2876]MBF4566584.1 hypothetical protein [Plantibacter sp. VKM Ac-2876]